MNSITEYVVNNPNKMIGIMAPNHEILIHIYREITRKLVALPISHLSSRSDSIKLSNGSRIFMYRAAQRETAFRGWSIDVLLIHELVLDDEKHEMMRYIASHMRLDGIIGTIIT